MFRRRRRGEPQQASDEAAAETTQPRAEETEGPDEPDRPARPDGPFDASEVDLEEARADRVDLGGLLVRAGEGMKLQLQVDKKTNRATSVLVVADNAAVQLMAVAAPRSSGMWETTMLQVATDAQRRGGTAEQAAGPFGTEVRIVLPATTQDGKKAVQPSRVAGIDGPRWMLRATFLGTATNDPEVFARMVRVVRDTVVIRGSAPMAPGDLIPLHPPERPDEPDVPAS